MAFTIDGPGGPSMAFTVDGPGGPVVAGDHLQRDITFGNSKLCFPCLTSFIVYGLL